MHILKAIQWLLGLVIAFYLYKALLGKLRDGDSLRAGVVAVIWFVTVLVTSGLIKIK
jgi:hypothetical protein